MIVRILKPWSGCTIAVNYYGVVQERELAESGILCFLPLLSLCIIWIHNRPSECLVNKDVVGLFEYVVMD